MEDGFNALLSRRRKCLLSYQLDQDLDWEVALRSWF